MRAVLAQCISRSPRLSFESSLLLGILGFQVLAGDTTLSRLGLEISALTRFGMKAFASNFLPSVDIWIAFDNEVPCGP